MKKYILTLCFANIFSSSSSKPSSNYDGIAASLKFRYAMNGEPLGDECKHFQEKIRSKVSIEGEIDTRLLTDTLCKGDRLYKLVICHDPDDANKKLKVSEGMTVAILIVDFDDKKNIQHILSSTPDITPRAISNLINDIVETKVDTSRIIETMDIVEGICNFISDMKNKDELFSVLSNITSIFVDIQENTFSRDILDVFRRLSISSFERNLMYFLAKNNDVIEFFC